MLSVHQTVFHITFGEQTEVWGAIALCPNVEPRRGEVVSGEMFRRFGEVDK